MKKTMRIALLLTALALLLCAAAEAEYAFGDYAFILLDDGTAEITAHVGNESALTIPNCLDGHPVTAIGDEAFSCLTSLISITIPDSVTKMGINPFRNSCRLAHIIVSPEHPTLETIDGVLFNRKEKKLICYPRAFRQDSYVIPTGVAAIGDKAFADCKSLTSITISDSVTSIGDEAFYSCSSLTSITIPDGVTSIGNQAFYNCYSLAGVTISNSVTSIGDYAFGNCSEALTFTVPRASWAEKWCRESGWNYRYSD